MSDKEKAGEAKLKHLIRLLDDDSEETQVALRREFSSFGPGLQDALNRLPERPTKDERRLIARILQRPSSSTAPRGSALFKPGALVKHKRYGYRGVVVELDLSCEARDDWYSANKTQPDRNQPWYHVLVHNSDQVTYAAQTSLEADASSLRIRHPLEKAFFSAFKNGSYIRNERPWPETHE